MFKFDSIIKTSCLSAFLLTLAACGGGSSTDGGTEPPVAEQPESSLCVTGDAENTNSDCGTLLLGITDADGDFLNYSVNVSGIEMVRIDGTRVAVMPTSETVNFVDYIELSELVTAATVPAGVYTSGTITVDYSNADIQVEKDGAAQPADMIDEDGNPLISQTLELQFDEDNRLIVARNRPALLEIDFNLAASHTVDLTAEPIEVMTEPYLIAEIDPVESKEFRVRGPLISVDAEASNFRIAVRPFHRQAGRFGGVNVQVDEETNFTIGDAAYVGEEGLLAMAELDQGTPTVTFGLFDRNADSFTAIAVLAGSAVPGADKDAARGVIVARDGNTLTVKGASLIRQDNDVTFSDEVQVLIADTTNVYKPRRLADEVTIADLSVGQAVTVLGEISETDSGAIIDATAGAVKMRITSASGHAVDMDGEYLTMALQAIQGRNPEVYNFAGTGIDETFDATPDAYEVATDNLMMSIADAGDPIRVTGFVSPFGSAPADFDAVTVINYAESRSQLVANWPTGDDVVALAELSSEGLTLNIVNTETEDGVYKLIQGGIRTDLASFEQAVQVSPLFERGIYTLRSPGTVQAFSDFADFAAELQQKLDEGMTIDLMHATGGFSTDSVTLSALKLHVRLDEAASE
ncbi:DUF4382 domain-containing protein [Aliikangiella marina]|uniref:DUF4382 domain-containing protein n=1 Tax=Aliikangiella marina TaxID=1712262 RepID=A0A545TDA8_9GAMM|nr:DUF4382 domain-containing protein [Aliikangiella marina]TQV75199.1 DUF4382 domain-containing protein [Aliikangiella marina]